MKQLLFTLLLFSPILAFTQSDKEKFEFSLIDSTDGTKPELFVYAKSWLANSFVSAKAVIEMEDKEAGKIIGKGILTIPVKATLGNIIGEDKIHFTITIDIKDNKYRCVLSDFYHKGGNYKGNGDGGSLADDKPDCGTFLITKKRWQNCKAFVTAKSTGLLDDLKKTMKAGKLNSDF